jgi:hypothetical protein
MAKTERIHTESAILPEQKLVLLMSVPDIYHKGGGSLSMQISTRCAHDSHQENHTVLHFQICGSVFVRVLAYQTGQTCI